MLLLNLSILAYRPPTIRCPRIRSRYIADKKSTTTTVTWPRPTATSYRNRPLNAILRSTKGPGSKFGRGTHTVVYEVKDDNGLKDFCMFAFTVTVIQCRPLTCTRIRYGRVHCDGSNYGHACDFSCNYGYELVGNRNIRCLRNGEWNHAYPQCVAKECPVLSNPANSKGFTCTNGRKVGSMCSLNCEKGYAPESTCKQFTNCSMDQTWTNLRSECLDVESPQIQNCPTQTVVKSKDPTSEQTYVTWEKPLTVTDNSGERIKVKAIGAEAAEHGGFFPEGLTLVRFTAQDRARNTASICVFNVRIETVRCDPPKMDDQYLETPGCVDYREGQSCKLQCYLAVELVGPRYMTCKKNGSSTKGYWSYGQRDSPTAEKPYCKVHNCTELRAPNFGAIACDNWELGRKCSIFCSEGYDIPESVSLVPSYYYCQTRTGRWRIDQVPDCVFREYGRKSRMKGYYYFHGSCLQTKPKIKSNFLKVINEAGACPRERFCTVENVRVRCGDETDDS